MRKFKVSLIIVIIVLQSILLSSCSNGTGAVGAIKENGILRVGCKNNVKGLSYYNATTGEYEGLEIEIAYEIAAEIFNCSIEKAKNKVEFVAVYSETREQALQNDEIDVILATYTITKERKEIVNFSTPYYTDGVALLVRRDAGILKPSDLEGKIIGVHINGTGRSGVKNYMDANGVTVQFREFNNNLDFMEALSKGEINAFATDASVLSNYLDDTTVILTERLTSESYGAATKLENTDLAELVDKVVNEVIIEYNLK